MSKVSIIVPIYNVEQYVEKCIKSLMNQTFKDIEIWAISDGSPDHSMDRVKELAKKDNRIKWIEKENGGYGSVLEYAIGKIQTEYFLICDPDDWLEEEAIEKLYQCAEKNKVDLVVGATYLIYNDAIKVDNMYSNMYPIEPNKVYSNLESFVFMSVTPHSKLYKTSLAQNIKFPHNVSYTDTILYLIYLTNIKNAVYLNIPFSNYFLDRAGNTMGEIKTYSQKAFNAQMTVYNSIIQQLDKNSYLYSLICYRLYALVLCTIKRIVENVNEEQLNKNKKEIIAYLSKLKPEKKNMKKYVKSESFFKTIINKIIFYLIFCDITQELALNCIAFLNSRTKKL